MFDKNVEWPTLEICQVKINTIWCSHFELLFVDVTSNRTQRWEVTIVILLVYLTFFHSYKGQTSQVFVDLQFSKNYECMYVFFTFNLSWTMRGSFW
jgi:hypothetical protein